LSGPDRGARSDQGQRLDKWLWAARFFKTRTLAAEAIAGGRVQVEGERVKPARRVRPGARVRIRKGALEWEVLVHALSPARRPAAEAAALYEETPESAARRLAIRDERRRGLGAPEPLPGRPDKRARRELRRLRGR